MEETVKAEPPAPPAPVAAAPTMSAPATLVGVFVRPKATFQALAGRPRILAPVLLLILLQAVLGFVLAQTGVIETDTIAKLEAKGTPQEQIDQVSEFMGGPMKYIAAVSGAVVFVFALLVSGALLYFMANLMLGARLRYAHYLCVAAYGGVVGMADQLTRTALAVSKGTLEVRLGVGAFLDESLSVPLRMLDAMTDPLLLWATAIEALGVAVMAKKGFGFGVLAVLPGFVVLLLISAMQR